jgi:single-strand DNA-binding protein
MDNVTVTVVGNLTADPEMRFTPSGQAVLKLRLASSHRRYDKNSSQWVDGDTTFLDASVWGDHADNALDVLSKGTKVIVTGRLSQRSYETAEGEKRSAYEVKVDEIGVAVSRKKESS